MPDSAYVQSAVRATQQRQAQSKPNIPAAQQQFDAAIAAELERIMSARLQEI